MPTTQQKAFTSRRTRVLHATRVRLRPWIQHQKRSGSGAIPSDQTEEPEQQNGAEKGEDERADEADGFAKDESRHKATEQCAHDTDNDVTDDPKSTTFDDAPGERTSQPSNDDPSKNAHC